MAGIGSGESDGRAMAVPNVRKGERCNRLSAAYNSFSSGAVFVSAKVSALVRP